MVCTPHPPAPALCCIVHLHAGSACAASGGARVASAGGVYIGSEACSRREPDGGDAGGGESALCQKKDIIISKFDELLKKLNGEELSANITMDRVSKEFKEAMTVCVRARLCSSPSHPAT